MANDWVAGVDLGGTSLLAVVADDRGKVLGEHGVATVRDQGPGKILDQIAEAVSTAAAAAKVGVKDLKGVGIGACGAVDPKSGVVRVAPNLGWIDVPVADKLSKKLGVPIFVENDVHVAVLGEHAYGAAVGAKLAVGIWVGTGIGGGIIANGKLFRGARGSAGEIGHMVVLADVPHCSCGRRGCVEALASRTSMERDLRQAAKAGRKTKMLKRMEKKAKDRMTSSVIEWGLDEGDTLMKEIFHRAQHYLGLLTSNLVNTLDPEVVVIGGGLAERMGDRFVKPIRRVARSHFLNQHDLESVKIAPSTLGAYSGALGACVLARSHHD